METTLRKTLLEMAFNDMVNVSKANYIGGLICIYSVVKTLQNVVAIGDFYKDYKERLLELGIRLLTLFEPEFSHSLSGNANFEELALRYNDIYISATTLKYFAIVVKEMADSLYSYKCHSMACNFIHPEHIQLFTTICKMYDIRVAADTIFSVTNHPTLNDNFNNLKDTIIEIFRVTCKYVKNLQANKQLQFKINHITELVQNRSMVLVESTYNLYRTEGVTLDKIEDMECLNDLMITSLRFLNKISAMSEYFEIFNIASRKLLVDVLLMNILISSKEKDLLEDNEKEFCELAHDICYEQKSKTIKSYSMKLLENLCDRVDYFFSYCMTLVLSMLDHALTGGDISNWPALDDLKTSRFFQMSKPEDRVDVGILIISAVSFFLILRPEKL